MTKSFLSLAIVLFASTTLAYIPSPKIILDKLADNAGNGVYQVEVEVQFPVGTESFLLKETWMVDGERNMKVVVTGSRELKDSINFSMTYANGMKTQGSSQTRLGDDFIEKYFHTRNAANMAQALAQMQILPLGEFNKKPVVVKKDTEYVSSPFVRLSRLAGTIAYAFGVAADPQTEAAAPGVWIEQDVFHLRKIRLLSQAEVSADKYFTASRGIAFPKVRTVRWGQNQVTLYTTSLQAKSKEAFTQMSAKTNRTDGLQSHAAKALVEDFYKRFR